MQETTSADPSRARKIAALNDRLRQSEEGGQMVVTQGIKSLGDDFIRDTLSALRSFSDFSQDNDPYGERDFGALTVNGQKVFWKVDYYDPTLAFGSEDPADPQKTVRVLTIMLPDEY